MATKPKATVKFDTKAIKVNLNKFTEEMWQETTNLFEGSFEAGASFAKENAPWTDRTGFARTSIDKKVDRFPKSIIGILGIGADYGIWLEIANFGKYRIIQPTLYAIHAQIKDKLKNIKLRI